MAEVTIPQRDAPALASPSVCAKTGAVTETKPRQRLVHTPGWIWILLFFGMLPFLIAYFATRRFVDVQIPISDELRRRRIAFRFKTFVVLVVSLAVAVLGAWRGETFPTVAGVVALVGVVAFAPVLDGRMWITARFDGESIQLSQLHPKYAAELDSARVRLTS